MNDFQKKYLLKRQDFGLLYPYLIEETVTDLNWNGRQLWIDDAEKGRYMADDILSHEFIERLVSLIANVTNQTFNREHPVLEAETEELCICVLHQSVAYSGTMISFKKTPAVRRLSQAYLVENGYCDESILQFLHNCIQAHLSIVICGLSGAGKTELLKYLTKYIPASEQVITIEDVMEIHYQKINPNKDCIEMKVAENFTYTQAMRTCLRQMPQWVIVSELQNAEIESFLKILGAGVSGITTISCDDVRCIPERIKNMVANEKSIRRLEKDTYRYVDVGILVKKTKDKNGKCSRRIQQISVFNRYGKEWKENINQAVMLVEDGKIISKKLPDNIIRKFREVGILYPMEGCV